MTTASFLARPAALGLATVAETPPALYDQARSLGRHLHQCREAQGRFFGLNRLATELHGWVAPRFVTTLALAAVLIGLACY